MALLLLEFLYCPKSICRHIAIEWHSTSAACALSIICNPPLIVHASRWLEGEGILERSVLMYQQQRATDKRQTRQQQYYH
eukprot:759652-Rhodomonas_salina.1